MKYTPFALLLSTCLFYGCMRAVTIPSPVASKGVFPAPAPLEAQNLKDALAVFQRIVTILPAWQQDELARFEGPELLTVTADIAKCKAAVTADEFITCVSQLFDDFGNLSVLDDKLKKEVQL